MTPLFLALVLAQPVAYQPVKLPQTTLWDGGVAIRVWMDSSSLTCGGGSGSSPLTTKGDLYTHSTVDARLPVGADGECLTADSAQATGLLWSACGSGGGAPTTASFITKVAEASLSNEFALGTLATGVLVNTTTTGVPTIKAANTCTNQFPRTDNASGAWTCASVADTDLTGTVSVTHGGHGAAPGADDQVFVSDTTSAGTWRSVPDCTDTGGNHLNYTAATNLFSCGTSSSGGGGGAPTTATYWTATSEASLSAETNLGALTTGLLKHTVSAGTSTPATATVRTDYVIGMTVAADGTTTTVSNPAPASTNFHTATTRVEIVSSNTAGSSSGWRAGQLRYWRGNAARLGGYRCHFRWGNASAAASNRGIIGLTASTAARANQNPSADLNFVGAFWDSTATAICLGGNDGTGTATCTTTCNATDFIARTNDMVFSLDIAAAPNSSQVTLYLKRLDTSGIAPCVATITASADMPANTAFLAPRIHHQTTTTTTTRLSMLKMYCAQDN